VKFVDPSADLYNNLVQSVPVRLFLAIIVTVNLRNQPSFRCLTLLFHSVQFSFECWLKTAMQHFPCCHVRLFCHVRQSTKKGIPFYYMYMWSVSLTFNQRSLSLSLHLLRSSISSNLLIHSLKSPFPSKVSGKISGQLIHWSPSSSFSWLFCSIPWQDITQQHESYGDRLN